MAVTVTPQINGQQLTNVNTYCYLYEPLRAFIQESSSTAKKIYIDVQLYFLFEQSPHLILLKYVEFDLNPSVGITVDLMKVAQQIDDAGVYKYGSVDNMIDENAPFDKGWQAIITNWIFEFRIYSDENLTPVVVKKIPIRGGRQLEQFAPLFSQSQALNEFEYYGLDINTYKDKWGGISIPLVSLAYPTPPSGFSISPDIDKHTTTGDFPCGGFIIWKSRFGGWMWWGFDIQTKSFTKNYSGKLEVGMFESIDDFNSTPYIPVDYTGINTSYSITLKALGLTSLELLAVSGIHASPAVYYMYPDGNTLELMRLSSFSAPISNLANGGDFSVSLNSISKTSQLTI